MTTPSILILGQDVATVDFTSHATPPGMTAETVMAGLHAALKSLEARGYAADLLQVLPDLAAAEAAVAAQLATRDYAVVVIGAGIRNPPPSLLLFEVILNAVHRHAPRARIAFNTRPEDSDVAAVRWVGR
jgi:hypothetical protein